MNGACLIAGRGQVLHLGELVQAVIQIERGAEQRHQPLLAIPRPQQPVPPGQVLQRLFRPFQPAGQLIGQRFKDRVDALLSFQPRLDDFELKAPDDGQDGMPLGRVGVV
jgi:hypothetical protein